MSVSFSLGWGQKTQKQKPLHICINNLYLLRLWMYSFWIYMKFLSKNFNNFPTFSKTDFTAKIHFSRWFFEVSNMRFFHPRVPPLGFKTVIAYYFSANQLGGKNEACFEKRVSWLTTSAHALIFPPCPSRYRHSLLTTTGTREGVSF